jgi:hypothetical protein
MHICLYAHRRFRSREGNDGLHFDSAHSWIGVSAVGLFALQWTFAVCIFANPWCSAAIRARLKSTHAAVGRACTVLTLVALSAGPLILVCPMNSAVIATWQQPSIKQGCTDNSRCHLWAFCNPSGGEARKWGGGSLASGEFRFALRRLPADHHHGDSASARHWPAVKILYLILEQAAKNRRSVRSVG